jgi:hypothetical protein
VPPPVDVARYFVCAQALTNVAKYGGANHGDVVVEREDGVLELMVSDDGVGGVDLRGALARAVWLIGLRRWAAPWCSAAHRSRHRITLRLPRPDRNPEEAGTFAADVLPQRAGLPV